MVNVLPVQYLNAPTRSVRSVPDRLSATATRLASWPCVQVCSVASATEVMLFAMVVVLPSASPAERPISLVVAACSSTAPAMVVW